MAHMTISLDNRGDRAMLLERTWITLLDINRLTVNRQANINSCLKRFSLDLKDHFLFRVKLMVKPADIAKKLDSPESIFAREYNNANSVYSVPKAVKPLIK